MRQFCIKMLMATGIKRTNCGQITVPSPIRPMLGGNQYMKYLPLFGLFGVFFGFACSLQSASDTNEPITDLAKQFRDRSVGLIDEKPWIHKADQGNKAASFERLQKIANRICARPDSSSQ